MIQQTPTTQQIVHASKVFKPCARNTIKCPGPGIYPNDAYSMTEYHAIEAVNASTLKKFIKSGKDGAHYLEGESEPPSSDMLFGTACHARIFEPEFYAKHAIDGKHPSDKGKTLADKCAWSKHKKVQDEFPDSIILHDGWRERIEKIAETVEGNPATKALFSHPGSLREVTLIWNEEVDIDGVTIIVPFKARLDMLNIEAQVIPDLKSTMEGGAAPHKFRKLSYDLGYHISAAIYVRGCLQLDLFKRDEQGRPPEGAYIALAAERVAPFIATPYTMKPEAIELGWEQAWTIGLKRLIQYRVHGHAGNRQYKVGEDSYGNPLEVDSSTMLDLDIPEWAMNANAGTQARI